MCSRLKKYMSEIRKEECNKITTDWRAVIMTSIRYDSTSSSFETPHRPPFPRLWVSRRHVHEIVAELEQVLQLKQISDIVSSATETRSSSPFSSLDDELEENRNKVEMLTSKLEWLRKDTVIRRTEYFAIKRPNRVTYQLFLDLAPSVEPTTPKAGSGFVRKAIAAIEAKRQRMLQAK